MILSNDKISNKQFQIFIILNIIGTSIILLPSKVASYAYEDSIFSVLIGILIALVSINLIIFASSKNTQDNFVQLLKSTFGSFIGIIISLLLVLKIIISTGVSLRIFTEITGQIMLPKTPVYIVGLIIICVSGFLASKGIEVTVRIFEIIVWFVFIFIFIVIWVGVTNFNLENLNPLFVNSFSNIFKGGLIVFFAFSGLEYAFVIYPFIHNKDKTNKASMIAVIIIGILILLTITVCIIMFSASGLVRQLWPVIEMMNSINFPGSFIERQDAFVLSFWIFMVFTSLVSGLFTCSILLKNTFKKGTHTQYIFVSIFLSCFLALLPNNIAILNSIFDNLIMYFTSFYLVFLPIIILIINAFKKER